MIQTKIIDNFYDTPSLVRQFALQQEFYKRSGNYPGLRTKPINELDCDFYKNFVKKLLSVYFDLNNPQLNLEWDIKTLFQWAGNEYTTGVIHNDDVYYDIAGVVYLTPNAPKNCGTSLYELGYRNLNTQPVIADPFTVNNKYNKQIYDEQLKTYNQQFNLTQKIENIYNRLVVYDSRQWHAQDGFWGTTKQDARLTQVFFARIKPC
jgi:hypothetical protein